MSAAHHPSDHPTQRVPSPALRVLAVIDALALPGLILLWLASSGTSASTATPSAPGGLLRNAVAVLVIVWAIRQAGRALFDFENYTWALSRVARWALMGLTLVLAAKAWYALAG